ncbi:DNA-binding LacI/PurR family transcriptional regulator [Rhizobium leguminosarum]|uniref:DNA-binding LacI/PurR family transcriptional regulator n=1 Tax=Rhizobium leguminosarum TaxID=384 RepID=A0AAE2MR47_RHILE|nr:MULTISPECIES: substrate-binding domain-containing protein [Rhizobium]ARM90981.1 LacI family transcriptional regulator protein [Rhizobium sp. CIAT894]MBB4293841.1 DNA-binding LacI/PurR family transcriptional regulator [Rhizobium leguminosarum]MBB4299574.1 DNA-binding LacI/PurR family transcriptional regulator [Rhizobium leguminosarum]MBB4311011.1 DNA-binding LacI/PurR family transcriptional regulator [Rhizobium leguminosarum]MBB4420140.1 DNA-binding LacI/PurR family transcriptional regulator
MKPTAKQVAHAVGVSIAAVSRAFTPGAPIDQEKRKRILAAAEQIGYISPARRTAKVVSAGTVTLVAGSLHNPFYPLVVDTLARHLQESDRRLLVYALPADSNVDTITEQILAARPSAIIITSAYLTSNMARACRQHQIKVVLLNRIQRDIRVNAVSCDNYQGGRDAGRLLLDRGFQRIGLIGGISNTSTHTERIRGFRDVLTEAGKTIHIQASGEYNYEVAKTAAVKILSASDSPNAIFCCNDIMALGTIDAARERGLRIPDDLAVIGFDDIPMASWSSYRLTTIRQPVERMVQEAVNLIDDPNVKAGDDGSTRMLSGNLIIRHSV